MLKQALAGSLTESEIATLSSAFDVIGDIAIIRVPEELVAKELLIANEILLGMKNVRTVLKQTSAVLGEFRTRELVHIGGEEKYVTLHKENGCFFRVDVRSVYFSPRERGSRAWSGKGSEYSTCSRASGPSP